MSYRQNVRLFRAEHFAKVEILEQRAEGDCTLFRAEHFRLRVRALAFLGQRSGMLLDRPDAAAAIVPIAESASVREALLEREPRATSERLKPRTEFEMAGDDPVSDQ